MTDFSEVSLPKKARNNLIEEIAAYAETDLLCYFAEDEKLYALQQASWEPILKWAEAHYEVDLNRTQGIMPVEQSPFWRAQMMEEMSVFDDPALVAFATLVTNLGSVFLALVLYKQAFDAEAVLAAAQLDEEYQQQEWGDDADIAKELAEKAVKVKAAGEYLLKLGESA